MHSQNNIFEVQIPSSFNISLAVRCVCQALWYIRKPARIGSRARLGGPVAQLASTNTQHQYCNRSSKTSLPNDTDSRHVTLPVLHRPAPDLSFNLPHPRTSRTDVQQSRAENCLSSSNCTVQAAVSGGREGTSLQVV
jgi:hypothetical protein